MGIISPKFATAPFRLMQKVLALRTYWVENNASIVAFWQFVRRGFAEQPRRTGISKRRLLFA